MPWGESEGRSPSEDYDRRVPVNLWAYAAVTVPFVATPGISTTLVLRNSVVGGVRAGVATAVGVNLSSIGYGLLTAFGISVALQRWPDVWIAMRVGGVGYLAWLGLRSLWRAARAVDGGMPGAVLHAPAARPLVEDAREGFVTNVLNPSIATFYLLVIPQFVPPDAPFAESALLLTAVHVTLAVSWHLTWAAAGGSLAAVLNRARPRRILEGAAGAALLVLAVKLSGVWFR
jgi:threonine/homoserine/homoserine lactone efflux protein